VGRSLFRDGIVSAYAAAALRLGLPLADGDDPEQAAREFLAWAETTTDRTPGYAGARHNGRGRWLQRTRLRRSLWTILYGEVPGNRRVH
jgi:hypothetical protein